MAYATVSDIESRWRALSQDEQSRASVLIDDASAMLTALVNVDSDDKEQAQLLKQVCCSMVIRAMSTADSYGVNQASMTAGPYTQSWSFAGQTGDLYFTKLEKRLLGITSGYIGTIEPRIGND